MKEELGLNELGAVVNQRFVGRVLYVDGRSLTMIARAAPKCRAGLMYGDAPICDPAPMTQRTIDLGQVTIQRHQSGDHLTTRMVVAGVLGGAAFGAFGYVVGPRLGFGKVGGCQEVTGTSFCTDFDGLTGEEIQDASERHDVEQLISDQRRGAVFFGLLGSTVSVILARQLSVGWVDVHPTFPLDGDEPWGVALSLPTRGR